MSSREMSPAGGSSYMVRLPEEDNGVLSWPVGLEPLRADPCSPSQLIVPSLDFLDNSVAARFTFYLRIPMHSPLPSYGCARGVVSNATANPKLLDITGHGQAPETHSGPDCYR